MSDPRPEVGRRCVMSGELLIWPWQRLASYARRRRRIFSSRLFPPAGDGTARRKSIGLSWPDASLCDGSMRKVYGINYGSASVRLRKTSTLWKLSGCLADRNRFQNDLNRFGGRPRNWLRGLSGCAFETAECRVRVRNFHFSGSEAALDRTFAALVAGGVPGHFL